MRRLLRSNSAASRAPSVKVISEKEQIRKLANKACQTAPSSPAIFLEGTLEFNKPYKALILKKVVSNKAIPEKIYVFSDNLGEGASCEVVLAYELIQDTLFAIKIHKIHIRSEIIFQERENLKRCEHYVEEAVDQNGRSYTIMVHIKGKNLLHYLYTINKNYDREDPAYFPEKKSLPFSTRLDIISLILKEVYLLHERGLFHRDIKTENFIIEATEEGILNLKLIDLDTAIEINDLNEKNALEKKIYAGTFGYVAPPLTTTTSHPPYTYSFDYFSMAIVIAEVLSEKNYQFQLKSFMKEMAQKEGGFRRDPTLSEIKNFLSDIFSASKTNDVTSFVHEEVIRLISLLVEESTLLNFSFENFKRVYQQLINVIQSQKKAASSPTLPTQKKSSNHGTSLLYSFYSSPELLNPSQRLLPSHLRKSTRNLHAILGSASSPPMPLTEAAPPTPSPFLFQPPS